MGSSSLAQAESTTPPAKWASKDSTFFEIVRTNADRADIKVIAAGKVQDFKAVTRTVLSVIVVPVEVVLDVMGRWKCKVLGHA